MSETGFEYSNLSGRESGPFIRTASLLLPGVRAVQRQVEPYAHAWERHNRAAAASSGPLWVVMGDSMSQGVGASAYDRGWVGQLAETLPDHRLVNLSVYGGRVADVVERQIPAMRSLGVEPDLVTVVIGSNDLFSRRFRPLLPAALDEMLRELPVGSIVGSQPGGQPASVDFNRRVDEAAAAGRVRVAEFRDPRMRSWRGRLSADHFHPNDAGYAGMAEIVGEAVARR
ncbi:MULTISPECIES: SGNH/GDSL hydrolase family protein [Aeromicrobium]|uniref:SGNH/GDSL hydrolase family protein n=1 Tax=Aeromicrobium TaxID=2040 RepID=UPI0006FB0894|nr:MULTISPECIES: SGNH/GDSL hydrolase family protein [Aeromicrobium]KQX73958.1 esterase [Aeromicrobium sp. Root472D3]MCL8250863.1 SGNH/GDSL hydrolase family protein [Aeromicrobium fastidiosum]